MSFSGVASDASGISVGVLSNCVRSAWTTNSTLYACWPSSYALQESSLQVDDPVWVNGSSLNAVCRLRAWGRASVSNNPLPGVAAGDFWVALNSTSTNGSVDPCNIYPGKVAAYVSDLKQYHSAQCTISACGQSSIAASTTIVTAQVGVASDKPDVTAVSGYFPASITQSTAIFPIWSKMWSGDKVAFVGVFGGAALVPTWYPSTINNAMVDIQLRGSPCVITATNRW